MWFSALKLGLNAATHIYKKKQETKMAMADAQHMHASKMARGESEYHGKLLEIIGSAHNTKEINQKLRQGCKRIIISRLFKTDYKNKPSYLGVVKFNLMDNNYNVIFHKIPLGGIRLQNLNKLKTVRSEYFAILSEVKKKPAIIRRLF